MTGKKKKPPGHEPRGFGDSTTEQHKPSGGRAVAQGIALDRNPSQRAPVWPDPPGADAARLLARLLGWGRR